MRITRKILTAIAFGVLIVANVITIIVIAQIAGVLGGLSSIGPQVQGIANAVAIFGGVFCGLTMALAILGIIFGLIKDRPTSFGPWTFEVYLIETTIISFFFVIGKSILASGGSTTFTPTPAFIASIILSTFGLIAMIVTLCLSRRRIGFQISFMVQLAIIITCGVITLVEMGDLLAGSGALIGRFILSIVSPAIYFVACFIGCFEKAKAHGKPKPQVRYDAYGYVIREKKPKPVYEYDEYGYRKPVQQAAPRPEPQPRPQKQYDEYGYEIRPQAPRPTAPQPRPAPQPTGVNQNASDELVKLKKMLDIGLITKEEYEAKRKKYLEML